MSGKNFFYGLLTGMVIGGVATLLLAPRIAEILDEEDVNDTKDTEEQA